MSFTNGSDVFTDQELLEEINSAQFEMLIPSLILVLFAMVTGLVGNIVTLLVYFKKMRRTASRIFIISLAICDLLNCSLTMPVEIAIICRFVSFDLPVICSVGRTITYILSGTSALLLIGIAVDRFRKICQPLKPVFTPRKTKVMCFASAAIGSAVYIPGFVIYGTQTVAIQVNANKTITGKTCLINDSYIHTKVPLYLMSFWFILTIAVMMVLIGLYSAIGRAVYIRLKLEEQRHSSVSATNRPKSIAVVDVNEETSCSFGDLLDDNTAKQPPAVLQKMESPQRNRLSEVLKNKFKLGKPGATFSLSKQKEMKRIRAGRTTIMLFSITIAYIISFIPFLVIVALRTLRPHLYLSLSVTGRSLWNFFLRSYVLNCACNPICYGFCNRDYREKVKEMLRQKLC